jgi:integrase
MPAKVRDTYYMKRRVPGIQGQARKSLGTKSKRRAHDLERMILNLADRARQDLVRAWLEDGIEIEELAEAYETGRLDELTARIERPAVTLDMAIEAALRSQSADVRKTTLARYTDGLGHLIAFAGPEALVADVLTLDTLKEFKLARREAGAAKETINNDLGALSVLATYAVEKGWITKRPSVKRFKRTQRIRYLEPDLLAPYMAHLRPDYRTMMQLLIGTGMRLGEAEGLRVCDLRGRDDGMRASIEDAKTAESIRDVFVPGWVAQELKAWIDRWSLSGTDRLFWIPRRTTQKEHSRACGMAGVHDYTIHDHRHTFAVQHAKAGMPLHLLQQQLGHKHISTTMRYAKYHPEYGEVSVYFKRVEASFGLNRGPHPGLTPADEEEARKD